MGKKGELLGCGLASLILLTAPAQGVEQKPTLEQRITKEDEAKVKEIRRMMNFGRQHGLVYTKSFVKVDLTSPKKPEFMFFMSLKDRIWSREQNGRYFIDKKWAEAQADFFSRQGYDIYMTEVVTAGGNLTRYLISQPLYAQARFVIHEGVHDTLKKKGIKLPLFLEEKVAEYIGNKLAIKYIETYHPHLLAKAKRDIGSIEYTLRTFDKNYEALSTCYSQKKDCSPIMERIRNDYKGWKAYCMRTTEKIKYSCAVNNAFFHAKKRYAKNYGKIEEILSKKPLRSFLRNPLETILALRQATGYQEKFSREYNAH